MLLIMFYGAALILARPVKYNGKQEHITPSQAMASQANQALPPGYQLMNYRIDKQLSAGGFSIVYLAHDENNVPVAIKEYLPSMLALRQEGSTVHATSAENLVSFRFGMKCFFEEGRALAKVSHPNVVRVLNFFRANETVYMVMQYERGKTLQEYIATHRGEVKESFIRRVFVEMLNGLREVHTHKMLHLDIKPANLYLRQDGTPVLIDFGAARQTLSADGPKLTPMFTPGFAPPEQYNNREQLGPWSDIYSVGATMYACLAAAAPQAADNRLTNDKYVPARKQWQGQYSEQLLETVDWCLLLDHLERPQSVFALQKALATIPEPKRKTLLGSVRDILTKPL
jgi:serine/threonine protein kinase